VASRDEVDQVGGGPAVPLGRVDLDRATAAAEAESRVGEDEVAVASEEVSLGSLVVLAAAEAVGGQDCRDGRGGARGVGNVQVVDDVAVLVSVRAETGGASSLIGNLGVGR